MISLSLKKMFTLSLFALTFNTYAAMDKELLIQHCRDLSKNINALISSQARSFCIEQLSVAAIKIDVAAHSIALDNKSLAKEELEQSVLSLHYAELNTCNRYIQISHSKFEAHKLKNLL